MTVLQMFAVKLPRTFLIFIMMMIIIIVLIIMTILIHVIKVQRLDTCSDWLVSMIYCSIKRNYKMLQQVLVCE